MTENLFAMPASRTQMNFRLDDWLKDLLDEYCADKGFIKERVVEALVYLLVEKGKPTARDIFEAIEELSARKKRDSQNIKKAG